MSTNSRIGVIRPAADRENHLIESIYCHWDGYPSYVGKRLLEHWADTEKLDALIALGDLSSLGTKLGEKHDFDSHTGFPDLVTKTWPKDTPAERGWCLFYDRDRGESNVGPKTHAADDWPDFGQEYEYLFDGDTWAFHDCYGHTPKPFQPLTQTAIQDDAD